MPKHREEKASVEGDGVAGATQLEAQLESLVDEIAHLIDAQSSARERDALQDYAVSLIRDRHAAPFVGDADTVSEVELGASDEPLEPGGRGSGAATLIGYGFLLLPASLVVLLVFPPIGALLGVASVGMMGAGLVTGLVSRVLPARRA